mgnify:CR=1 FL=1
MVVIRTLEGFGDRLRTAIQKKGYTQKELSEILQVNQDTITNYIKEKSFPKADMLLNICDLLDISIDWLIKGQEHKSETKMDFSDVQQLTEIEKEIIKIYRELDSRDREEIRFNMEMKYKLMLNRKADHDENNADTCSKKYPNFIGCCS